MKNNKSRRSFIKNMAIGGAFAASISSTKAIASQPAAFGPKPKVPRRYWKNVRSDFSLNSTRAYLNTASLGASPKIVIEEVYQSMLKLERIGEGGHELAHAVHQKIADFVNCKVDELAITRNTTEGMNIIANSLPLKAGDEVLITTHAHIGGAAPWLALQRDKGVKVNLVDLDLTGKDNLSRIVDHITPKTKAIAISHVTCTTGMVLPVKEIIKICRERGIYSCIDGAHPFGMMQLNLGDLQPDFYASSGHKWLLGPKGTGILYINQDIIKTLTPRYVGAYSPKEYNLKEGIFEHRDSAQRHEYGTRNTPIVLGLGKAIDYHSEIGIVNIEHRGKSLATFLKKKLSKLDQVEVLTPMDDNYSASIVTFRVNNQPYQKVQAELQKKARVRLRGIYENNLNGVRISCAFYNNESELNRLVYSLKENIEG